MIQMRLYVSTAVSAALAFAGPAGAGELFDDCGTLVEGAECVLFQSDSGGLYLVSERGGFLIGDRVRVTGDLDTSCVSACLEGQGCIQDNQITDCDGLVAACGTLVSRNQCAILQADDGQEYVLDQYGGFSVGQRVHVLGEYEAECGGECASGVACIRNNTIHDADRYCDEPGDPDDPPVYNVCGTGALPFFTLSLGCLMAVRRGFRSLRAPF